MGDNLSPTVWFLIKTLASCTAISAISLSSACKQFYTPTESMHIFIGGPCRRLYQSWPCAFLIQLGVTKLCWLFESVIVLEFVVRIDYFSVICCLYQLLFCNLLFVSVFYCSLLLGSVIVLLFVVGIWYCSVVCFWDLIFFCSFLDQLLFWSLLYGKVIVL